MTHLVDVLGAAKNAIMNFPGRSTAEETSHMPGETLIGSPTICFHPICQSSMVVRSGQLKIYSSVPGTRNIPSRRCNRLRPPFQDKPK